MSLIGRIRAAYKSLISSMSKMLLPIPPLGMTIGDRSDALITQAQADERAAMERALDTLVAQAQADGGYDDPDDHVNKVRQINISFKEATAISGVTHELILDKLAAQARYDAYVEQESALCLAYGQAVLGQMRAERAYVLSAMEDPDPVFQAAKAARERAKYERDCAHDKLERWSRGGAYE